MLAIQKDPKQSKLSVEKNPLTKKEALKWKKRL